MDIPTGLLQQKKRPTHHELDVVGMSRDGYGYLVAHTVFPTRGVRPKFPDSNPKESPRSLRHLPFRSA